MQYKILELGATKTNVGQYGNNVYSLNLEGVGWVELMQKPTTPVPAKGQTLEGTIEQTDFGMRFKKTQMAPQGGGGFRAKSPEETKAIQRQHSQEMAIRFLAWTRPNGGGEDPHSALNLVKSTTDWFEADIAGSQGGGDTLSQATNEGQNPAPPAALPDMSKKDYSGDPLDSSDFEL